MKWLITLYDDATYGLRSRQELVHWGRGQVLNLMLQGWFGKVGSPRLGNVSTATQTQPVTPNDG